MNATTEDNRSFYEKMLADYEHILAKEREGVAKLNDVAAALLMHLGWPDKNPTWALNEPDDGWPQISETFVVSGDGDIHVSGYLQLRCGVFDLKVNLRVVDKNGTWMAASGISGDRVPTDSDLRGLFDKIKGDLAEEMSKLRPKV